MGYSSYVDAEGRVCHDPCFELEAAILDEKGQSITDWRRVEAAYAKGCFDGIRPGFDGTLTRGQIDAGTGRS